MIQQINLYQPMFRKQEKVFSAKTMLQAFGIVVFGFILFYGYARWNVYSLAEQAEQLEAQKAREVGRLESLGQKYPVKRKSRSLEAELARLQKERDAKSQLVALLAGRSIGNTSGFSNFLEGVARRRVPGMWVRGLTLADGGTHVGIQGSTLEPELVPRFLQALAHERSFEGTEFHTFEMVRPKDDTVRIDFALETISERAP